MGIYTESSLCPFNSVFPVYLILGSSSLLKHARLYCTAAARRRHGRYVIDRSTKVYTRLE